MQGFLAKFYCTSIRAKVEQATPREGLSRKQRDEILQQFDGGPRAAIEVLLAREAEEADQVEVRRRRVPRGRTA